MSNYSLQITLLSDTTFGSGDGVAGLIDAEIEHDEFGLPFLRGRALKGLIAEECANTLFSLEKINLKIYEEFKEIANKLFGTSGSGVENDAEMNISNARLPQNLHQAVEYAIYKQEFTADEVLKSLTTTRRQTAMTEKGAPKEGSLRSMRAILRETILTAEVDFNYSADEKMLVLLAVSAISLQRAGLGRNRGHGKISVKLFKNSTDKTAYFFNKFEQILNQTEAE